MFFSITLPGFGQILNGKFLHQDSCDSRFSISVIEGRADIFNDGNPQRNPTYAQVIVYPIQL